MAATLHHDFAYVLTYLYDRAHHDHSHVDNGLSGDGPTREATSAVLDRIGTGGPLRGADSWRAFLDATARHP